MLTTHAGNIRIGDYILIVDSDTRVPRDCLLDAASEMEQNPSMAVLQYASVSYSLFFSPSSRGTLFAIVALPMDERRC